MAKTAKLKKKQVAPHSRAARRAASPSIKLPEDVKTRTRDSHSPSRPSEAKHHVLSAQNAGISKKKGGNLKRAQRVRAQKAMERAADDMDKWELKKAKSITKAASIKERAKLWDDINGESTSGKKSASATLADDNETAASKKEREWVSDEDMDDAAAARDAALQSEGKTVEAAAAAPASGPAASAQEDELL
ncbi:uncharacterized protein EKO05_0005266 [Ascochyta rabiei]|uniref:Uncharacterized protein n=1 Tax=Didymella rabiei TaxID=5454 RepID=A0A163L4Q9_DIDRA|nr:uncharacterized protein EKO05_0005266 [Ascochyta rabiei]KZM27497.1 hypothetical protein ST47_g1358 [Ascochyta rabiei]UPX14794.1 hypothetical protein EKO05_0005266 [Ascochyta rabiei]